MLSGFESLPPSQFLRFSDFLRKSSRSTLEDGLGDICVREHATAGNVTVGSIYLCRSGAFDTPWFSRLRKDKRDACTPDDVARSARVGLRMRTVRVQQARPGTGLLAQG